MPRTFYGISDVKLLDRGPFWCYEAAMTTRLRQQFMVPFLALGMGIEIESNNKSFLQTPPSAEEIASDTLQERQDVSPVEAMKSLPGVVILGSEVTTYTGSMFLRGANGDQTLFLWNDFRADNFTAPTGATDPFGFGAEFSNQIRVLKGPQSLLYGTQAMGGVVLIDNDPDLPSSLELAGGSLGTSRGVAETRIRGGRWQLSVGGSAFSSEGVSAFNSQTPRGPGGELERDGRQKSSGTVLASFDLPSEDQLQFMLSGLRDTLSDDAPPQDDLNARTENRATQWKLRYKANWTDAAESVFLITGQETDRENANPLDNFNSNYYLDQSMGHRLGFLNRNTIRLSTSLVQVGLEFNDEQGRFVSNSNFSPQNSEFSPRSNDQSVYFVNDWNFKSSDLSWGLRGNCQDGKSCLAVYQLSYQWHWAESERSLYGILSSGLKRPTLYQLYSGYGDPALKAEHSQAYEVGVVQRFGAPQKVKLAVFENQFTDLIDYDFSTSKYKNLKRAKTLGAEIMHQYDQVFWDTQFSLAQVYSKDLDSGSYLLRRPLWQGAWALSYGLFESLRLMNEFVYVGEREDSTGANQRVTLAAVALWNVGMTYKGASGQYFLRVNNLGNTFHEDIKGYLTPGRFVWLGTKLFF